MTEQASGLAAVPPAEPVTLERGRYRLSQTPDGGMTVARAVELCESCSECGCGQQAELITVPAFMMRMASAPGMAGKFRAMMGGGHGS
jgi:hypothetical protein